MKANAHQINMLQIISIDCDWHSKLPYVASKRRCLHPAIELKIRRIPLAAHRAVFGLAKFEPCAAPDGGKL